MVKCIKRNKTQSGSGVTACGLQGSNIIHEAKIEDGICHSVGLFYP